MPLFSFQRGPHRPEIRHSAHYIANSAKYDYSNGSLEGINRKIKNLKRSCILKIYYNLTKTRYS
ncbi:transposase [Limosilactobacillus mucosae]|uniref:transposase n=1 Tax=Limosilactobacillus mucosae TaxID=97478 RepID=UPI003A523014